MEEKQRGRKMTIQPHRIYKLKTKKGEFTCQMVGEKIHSKIFKDTTGKKFEVENSEILSYEILQDLTEIPYKHQDRDKRLKYKKSGRLVPTYKQY